MNDYIHPSATAARQVLASKLSSQASSMEPERPATVLEAAIQNHASVHQRLMAAAEELETIADRVFGMPPPTPVPGSAVSQTNVPFNGQVLELSSLHDSVNGQFGRLFDVIGRLRAV